MKTSKIIPIHFFLTAAQGIIVSVFLLSAQSDIKNSVFLGYSLERLVLAGGVLAISCLFFMLAILYLRKPVWHNKIILLFMQKNNAIVVAFLVLSVSGVLFLLPNYRFGSYEVYFLKLFPILIWGEVFSIQTLLIFAVIHEKKLLNLSLMLPSRRVFIFVGYVFFLFLIVWGGIAISGVGIIPDDRYWNVASVPILNEQILMVILGSLFFVTGLSFLENKYPDIYIIKKQNVIIFFLLWGIAALIWIQNPLPHNFFAPGPYPPNNELAPFADAATFDLGGQFALIGQGLFNGVFFDRVLLSGFLVFLHTLAGQNYSQVITLQVAIFAILIPILYLLGSNLYNRISGIALALFSLFRVSNAISSSTIIQSSHPKYMLTEFPTRILIALFILWLVLWVKRKNTNTSYLIAAGGVLGLGIMLRTNVFLLFLVAFAFILIRNDIPLRNKMKFGFVFTMAFFITISPWMWRNQQVANTPFFFLPRFENVLGERYSQELPEGKPDIKTHSRIVGENVRNYSNLKASEFSTDIAHFTMNHFFHNIVTSVMMLPTSPIFHDLNHTLKEAYPYWNKVNGQWLGQLTIISKIYLTFNLFIIALGVVLAWERWRSIGLIPLAVFLTYYLSNALARTSGGRYLVPVDWVVLLYFAIGLMQIVLWGMALFQVNISLKEPTFSLGKTSLWMGGVLSILPFFFIVFGVTVVDRKIPQRYPERTKEETMTEIIEDGWLKQTNISKQELFLFLQQPTARVFLGRSLYPRFYQIGEGEHSAGKDAFEDKDFPRITFTMIGQFGQTGVILPLDESPAYFPNASDVIVIGCQHPIEGYISPYIDAFMVILLDGDQEIVYTREPELQFQCPLSEPVCDGNRQCR